MKVKNIAAVVLILYAAFSVAFAFHNHITDQPGNHCSVCHVLHSPSNTPVITTYAPLLTILGTFSSETRTTSRKLLVSSCSERAPPSL